MKEHSNITVNSNSRQSSLDALRCIAALLVIFIHLGPSYLNPITRTAVPIFFIISGYFYPIVIARKKFWQHFRKILTMALCASSIYGLWTICHEYKHGTLYAWFEQTCTIKNIIQLIIMNEDMFRRHLWFFWALLYDLLALRVADHFDFTKYFKLLAPLLLIAFFVLAFSTPNESFYRNWLFMGLPFMMIGRWIKEEKEKCHSIFYRQRGYAWIVGLSLLFSCLENYLFGDILHEMFLSTVPLVIGIFSISLQHPHLGNNTIISNIGRKHSANIFIISELVALNFQYIPIVNKLSFGDISYPFMIFLISWSLSIGWLKLKDSIVSTGNIRNKVID